MLVFDTYYSFVLLQKPGRLKWIHVESFRAKFNDPDGGVSSFISSFDDNVIFMLLSF